MNFREKVKYLLFIIFICLFLFPFITISKKENFENSSYGKWELVLRQTSGTNGFTTKNDLNLDASYDSDGNITKDNFYNSELINNCKWDNTFLLKLNYYIEKKDTDPDKVIIWKQPIIDSNTQDIISDDTNFKGIIKGDETSIYISNYDDTLYMLGEINSTKDYIEGYLYEGATVNVEKVELMVWNPRPRDVNSYNNDFKSIKISKIDLNKTEHKEYYNKVLDISGEFDEDTNRYSYCFGKLRCSNIEESPTLVDGETTYKPYCNSDNSNNPVYCEGSILYNVNSEVPKSVNINDCSNNNYHLSLDMMGKYANEDDLTNDKYYNLFRGLTTPYSSEYTDPKIDGNYVTMYDSSNSSTKIKTHLCNFFSNTNLDNGTNIQTQCFEQLPEDDICDSDNVITIGKKCIANYGTNKIETKYHDFVCSENEKCVGYECGSSFGNCEATTL